LPKEENGTGVEVVGVAVSLDIAPERRLIREDGSFRHVDFRIGVGQLPAGARKNHLPLTIALMLDRSGSMAGEKLETAERATLAVVDQLQEQDQVAVVVFDDQIDVLQPAVPVVSAVKDRVRRALAGVEARATTALRQGWLTGCQAIAADHPFTPEQGLARCLLLTDGIANVGITDPEQIAGVRENTGIGTSTFGVGADYNENLHHLRHAGEIATTFTGELFAVAVRNLRFEIVTTDGVVPEMVSAYWLGPLSPDKRVQSVTIGDRLPGKERHIVIRFGFPPQDGRKDQAVRGRLVWSGADGMQSTLWQEVRFTYASRQAIDAESQDPAVMHWAGLHHAARAKIVAAERSKHGDLAGAWQAVEEVASRIAAYARDDQHLWGAVAELQDFQREVVAMPLSAMSAKETRFQAQRHSRGQKDLRGPQVNGGGPADLLAKRFLRAGLTWPTPVPDPLPVERLRDLYRGCLLWGAAGDALGRAVEGRDPAAIRDRFGPRGLQDYVPWPGWHGGPRGMITDDTQLTIEVAQSLLATGGQLDPEDLSRRLIAWLPTGRGKGQATTEAIQRMVRGQPWWEAGQAVNSAGNGAAMRAAPVGLVCAFGATPFDLQRDAVLSALPTHAHPIGVAAAVVIAAGVAYALRQAIAQLARLDPQAFVDFVVAAIEGMEPERTRERRPGGGLIRLSERLAELPGWLNRPPEEVFKVTWNGAFALESVPAAVYCFLRTPDDPRQVILTAVNAGHDADTVASMAGNLAGAWNGIERLRQESPTWWSDLEYRDDLIDLANQLLDLALHQI